MGSNPSQILKELLELDPSLAPHKGDLEKSIKSILKARPDTRFSNQFKRELYQELAERFDLPVNSYSSSQFMFMANKFLYGGIGAALGALVVFVISQQSGLPTFEKSSDGNLQVSSIEQVGSQAFGSLATATDSAVGISARPQSGGGGGGGIAPVPSMATAEMAVDAGGDADTSNPVDAKMIAPYPMTMTDYIYNGELTLPSGDVTVLKRIKGGDLPANVSALLSGFSSDLLDWGSFSGLRARNVTLSQGGKEPFTATIDYLEGTISLYKEIDWASRPESRCTTDACYQQYRMKESDMLPDDQLVDLADAFMSAHGIDRSAYGEPVVDNSWRIWMEQTVDRSQYYFPESLSVIYPVLIDGKPVYEEYGQPYGVNVTIDMRRKEATGLYNLSTRNFQSSAYPAADDLNRLKEVIKNGGVNVWRDPSGKVVQAELGEPTEGFVHMWHWNQGTSVSSELFVPALIFEITNRPDGSLDGKTRVVVPLAKELLESTGGQVMPLEDGPAIMPLEVETRDLGDATGGETAQ